MMEDLTDVERDKKEKKLQIPKPDAYGGSVESNLTYQRWYETINNYLYHNRGSWEGHSDLIRVVGAFMKGKARDWYDNRARQPRSYRKIDTWSAFVSAMDVRFTTSQECELAYAEMHRVKYQGSVITYNDKLIGLNDKANMSGRACRTVLVNGLPHELRKDLAKLHGESQRRMMPCWQPSKRLALLLKSFPKMRNLMTRALGQPPLEKAKAIANASGSLKRQMQLRRRTPLLLGSKPRRHPLLDLDLGNQDFPKTCRMRR